MNGLLKKPFGFLAGCLSLALCLPLAVEANNLRVSNVSLTNTLKQAGTTDIKFDLSWENSWRASWTEAETGAGHDPQTVTNWDAAWVFIKYRLREGANTNWQHVHLASEGHVAPEGITITPGATDGNNVGAFIYRSVNGFGPLDLADLCLRWDYGAQNLKPSDPLDISVQAIEMVYVPAGPFYLGCGGTPGGSFTEGSWESDSTIPFYVASEAAITVSNAAGCLWGNNPSGLFTIGTHGILPTAYPKGFQAFYSMKYEITQEQYMKFLNQLTATQASKQFMANTGTDRQTIGTNEFGLYTNGAPDRVANWMKWQNAAGYAAWAGLRLMTELEFEKACRGVKFPVANEYAWGATAITRLSGYTGEDGSGTETASATNANAYNMDNTTYFPGRPGIFATDISGRQQSGASYWGIMELSSSVVEICITMVYEKARLYEGSHGTGVLDVNGQAPNPDWYAVAVSSCGLRTGMPVGGRYLAGANNNPWKDRGGRGVRTAP